MFGARSYVATIGTSADAAQRSSNVLTMRYGGPLHGLPRQGRLGRLGWARTSMAPLPHEALSAATVSVRWAAMGEDLSGRWE